MTANIISKLTETLAQKTEAALADLAGLEQQITEAIEQATPAAQARIDARLAGIDATISTTLLAFEDSLAEMAGLALTQALNHIADRLDAPEPTREPSPIVIRPADLFPEVAAEEIADPEAAFVQRSHEFAAVAAAAREEAEKEEAADPELPQDTSEAGEPITMPTHAVAIPTADEPVVEALPVTGSVILAAHANAAEPIGILTGDDDHDEQADILEPDAIDEDGTPTTDDPTGLHTRYGEGRRTRYELEPLPVVGETYFVRGSGRRYTAVRYIG